MLNLERVKRNTSGKYQCAAIDPHSTHNITTVLTVDIIVHCKYQTTLPLYNVQIKAFIKCVVIQQQNVKSDVEILYHHRLPFNDNNNYFNDINKSFNKYCSMLIIEADLLKHYLWFNNDMTTWYNIYCTYRRKTGLITI